VLLFNFLPAILAVAIATPSPSAAQREPPTIVTVISSPYCNSLADHFNGALVPMLANDRTLDGVGVQLDQINTLFSGVDYVQQYVSVRNSIGREEAVLNRSLSAIQREINALRAGAALTTDAQATAQIRQAAQDLQTAYDHQRQVSIDLQGLYWAMTDYNIARTNPALGGFNEQEMAEPAEMKNIKSYLHFDSQRSTIAINEDQAVDIAYTAAQAHCLPKK
jgi:hypothetical protein